MKGEDINERNKNIATNLRNYGRNGNGISSLNEVFNGERKDIGFNDDDRAIEGNGDVLPGRESGRTKNESATRDSGDGFFQDLQRDAITDAIPTAYVLNWIGILLYIKCYNHDSWGFGGNLFYNLKVKRK